MHLLTKRSSIIIPLIFSLLGFKTMTWGQNIPFPYNINVQTIIGQCYDDCTIIITMTDAQGNLVDVNPQTHNAADLSTYPLYNIQYHYRNMSTTASTRYDTVNTISVTNGVYCIGITAYVPITTPSGATDYALVDTTVCDIDVSTNYEHLEASVLSLKARNNWECGVRPSFQCADRGRIQLQLTKGKYPYNVIIIDDFQDTIRQVTFWQRMNDGEHSDLADYRDYYTFDNMPIGNFGIMVSDSCGYSIWLTITIPDAEPYNNRIYNVNRINCIDTNVIHFIFQHNGNESFHDFDFPYLDSILQYRFINPGNEVTPWRHVTSIYDEYIADTITGYHSFCPIYEDTIKAQIRNLCQDTITTFSFAFTRNFEFYDIDISPTPFGGTTIPDTCLIHANSVMSTQTYHRMGDPNWCNGCGYDCLERSGGYEIPARFFTCPIYYDVYSAIDSTLIAHAERDYYDFSYMDAPVTFYTDTVIPVHIAITDAQGCWLAGYDSVFVFNVQQAGDITYQWVTHSVYDDYGYNRCCWDRYFWLKEEGVNFHDFRQNVIIRLIESPLYNKFNFTAVFQNGEWTVTHEHPSENTMYMNFYEDDGWKIEFRDSVCLVPGRYVFAITTECGTDTISYKWTEDPSYYTFQTMDAPIQYETFQLCDKYYIRPITTNNFSIHRIYLDADIDNDTTWEDISPWGYSVRVFDGMTGGYNEYSNNEGYFVFTIPGKYILTYSTWWDNCEALYIYDTVEFVPTYLDLDRSFALLCDYLSQTGVVLTHAINGKAPYVYYLYDQPEMQGNMIATSTDGYFSDIPMHEGQQLSVMVSDSCHNSFYINLTVTSISQNVMAWEYGEYADMAHCEGDSTFIAALPFNFQAAYQWTGPNGFSSNSRDNIVHFPYGSESGWYVVEILNTGCQTAVVDSIYFEVVQAPRVSIFSESPVCPGTDAILGITVQGYGAVSYSIYHNGEPASGPESFIANPGDTIYQAYPIMSENTFWADNISDARCAYHYLIDSISVDIIPPASFTPVTINTTGAIACYNHSATLTASANLSYPYYICWYESPRQAQLLKCDTIWQAGTLSSCQIDHLISDSSLYVTAFSEGQCGSVFGAIYQQVNMSNGNTVFSTGEGVRLYDSGGEHGTYSNNEHYTHTFCCPTENRLWLRFNSVSLSVGDTLYIYSGNTAQTNSLLLAQSHGVSPTEMTINSSCVTFVFHSNGTIYGDGWSIDILSGAPMTIATANLAPQMFDTIAATLCPSNTPFLAPGFPPIDISQPIEYLIDTLIETEDGCEIVTHLHLVVNSTSDTSLYMALMPCELPYQWNGITFSDYGTQNATISNQYGCDSLVRMTVSWAPPVDSTTVFDTIVENQLPYTTHGLVFHSEGVQIATLTNHNGCDSIVTIYLHVYHNVTAEADSVICDDVLPFLWNGISFTESDTQTVILTASTGADSTLTMYLTVLPTSRTLLYDTICQYEDYSRFGFNLSSSETSGIGQNTFTRILPNQYNCDSVILLNMLITPDVTPEFEANPDRVMLSEGGTIPFFNQTDISNLSGMHYYWVWDFGDGTGDTTTEYDNSHTYEQWGDYDVTLKLVANRCETEVTHTAYVEADLIFPNVITPNGDGKNDVFIIKDLNPERENELFIYDRWGREVYHQKNYQTYMRDDQVFNTSEGFGMDPKLNEGTFFYSFNYKGMVKTVNFHGTITIIRERK